MYECESEMTFASKSKTTLIFEKKKKQKGKWKSLWQPSLFLAVSFLL